MIMKTSRDTTTGSTYEQIIELCLRRACKKNDMTANSQVTIGIKPGGGKHRIDWELVQNSNSSIRGLISCKFQRTSGTAEEKIAYEVIKLLHAMDQDTRFKKSWIIMGGDGWSSGMRQFVRIELVKWLPAMTGKVVILSTDELLNSNLALS
jgi:hypothetical protein